MNTTLYIRFRNTEGDKFIYEVYKSPPFDTEIDMADSEELDNLVVDGDEEEDFCISCDMEMHDDNIIWLMFQPYDQAWVEKLFKVWQKHLGFELPPWKDWTQVSDIEEAFSNYL